MDNATIINKINAIAVVNSEIIGRIETAKNTRKEVVTGWIPRLVQNNIYGSGPAFQISLSKSTVNGSKDINVVNFLSAFELVRNYRMKQLVTAVTDTFNDQVNYQCSTFENIKLLNDRMIVVANKYKLFGESGNVKPILTIFKSNFEILQGKAIV